MFGREAGFGYPDGYGRIRYKPFTGTSVRADPSRGGRQVANRSHLSRPGSATVSAQIGFEQGRATAGVVLPVRRGECERAEAIRRSCELALLGSGETSRCCPIAGRV